MPLVVIGQVQSSQTFVWDQAAFVRLTSVEQQNFIATFFDSYWQHRQPELLPEIKEDLGKRHNTQVLYYLQSELGPLLRYAVDKQAHHWVDAFAQILLLALPALTEQNQLPLDLGGATRVLTYPTPQVFWADPEGKEIILHSSQFLYFATQLLNAVKGLPAHAQTEHTRRYAEVFAPVIDRHYTRWVLGLEGNFQVRAWGCGEGTWTHEQLLTQKSQSRFAKADGSHQYCNMITDTDLWIMAGVMEWVMYSEQDSRYTAYIRSALEVVKQRLKPTQITDFYGLPTTGYDFDVGSWDAHPAYRYAAYAQDTPTDNLPEVRQSSWDIGHAARFVWVFETFGRYQEQSGNAIFDADSVLQGLARQMAYRVFNRDWNQPRFTNFLGGQNGWFAAQPTPDGLAGTPPFGLSASVLYGGYTYLTHHNQDFQFVAYSLWDALLSGAIEGDPAYALLDLRRQPDTPHTYRVGRWRMSYIVNFWAGMRF